MLKSQFLFFCLRQKRHIGISFNCFCLLPVPKWLMQIVSIFSGCQLNLGYRCNMEHLIWLWGQKLHWLVTINPFCSVNFAAETNSVFQLNLLSFLFVLRNNISYCAGLANIRVGQITLLFSKRLVFMAKFDVEHESVNRCFVWWRLIPLKFENSKWRPKWRNLQENG